MKIYPAIDLKNGRCVRLYQGDFAQQTVYAKDPCIMAQKFAVQGTEYLHVVDLDGAKQEIAAQHDLIVRIYKETNLKLQVGGGVRKREQITLLLNNGIERVVLGSVAINNPQQVVQWIEEFGSERIVVAVDVWPDAENNYVLKTRGWQSDSKINLWDLLTEYCNHGLKHILCTDIKRDGTLQGPNISLYRTLVRRFPELNVQASGGVCSLMDIEKLTTVPVAGVITGRALYENKFTLKEAIDVSKTHCSMS